MAAWQRLPAGAACAGQGAPCPPVPAAQDQPLRGFVKPVLWYVPRLRGVFLRGSRVLPRRRHRSLRISQRREGLGSCLPFLVPPPVLTGSGSVENKRQTVRTKQNTFPWRGGECLRTARLASERYFCGLCPPLGLRRWEPWRSAAARPSARSLPDAPCPARPSFKRLALARASSVTALLVYNCFK